MASNVNPIPEGTRTVTPYLVVKGAAEALEFYKKVFGAEEICRMEGPGGGCVMHAELKIGDSFVFLADEFPGSCTSPLTLGGTTVSIHLYVENVDAIHDRAVAAGAKSKRPPANMFWGDRFAQVQDPFGHEWGLATHVEDVTPEEMARRGEEYATKMATQHA